MERLRELLSKNMMEKASQQNTHFNYLVAYPNMAKISFWHLSSFYSNRLLLKMSDAKFPMLGKQELEGQI